MARFPKYLPSLTDGQRSGRIRRAQESPFITDEQGNLVAFRQPNGRRLNFTPEPQMPPSEPPVTPEPPVEGLEPGKAALQQVEQGREGRRRITNIQRIGEIQAQAQEHLGRNLTGPEFSQVLSGERPIESITAFPSVPDIAELKKTLTTPGALVGGMRGGVDRGAGKLTLAALGELGPDLGKGALGAGMEFIDVNRAIGLGIEKQIPFATQAREATGRFIQKAGQFAPNPLLGPLGPISEFVPGLRSVPNPLAATVKFLGRTLEDEPVVTPLDIAFFAIPVGKLLSAGLRPIASVVRGQGLRRVVSPGIWMLPTETGFAMTTDTNGLKSVLSSASYVKDVLGLRPIEPHLSHIQNIKNLVRGTLGRPLKLVEDDPVGNAVMSERGRLIPIIDTQGNQAGIMSLTIIRGAFDLNKRGGILALKGIDPTIKGAPTIADVAARLPLYIDSLSPSQVVAIRRLQEIMKPYGKGLDDVGVEVGKRPDVMDGGFYIPRGSAELEGFDIPIKIRGVAYGRAKPGFERPATFPSQSAGIDDGWEYLMPWDAITTYAKTAGDEIATAHVTGYLKNVRNEAGELLASKAKDRVDDILRNTVNRIRNSIRTTRETLVRRTVRGRAGALESGRASRSADDAAARSTRASERLDEALEGYSQADHNELREQMRNAFTRGRALAYQLGGDLVRLRNATGALTRTERAIQRKSDELLATISKLEALEVPGQRRAYQKTQTELSRLNREIESLVDEGGALSDKVDSLIDSGRLLSTQSQANRTAMVATRQFERMQQVQAAAIGSAEREMRLLLAEARRADKFSAAAAGRSTRSIEREATTAARYDSLRNALRDVSQEWEREILKSRATPIGYAPIPLRGLEGLSFPDALANTVNKILRREGARMGPEAGVLDVVNAYNNFYRWLSATMDNSAPGIQGLMAMYSDPVAYSQALKLNLRSWAGGDKTLGLFMENFNTIAKSRGRMNSLEWGREGLRIGGAETEFQLGAGFSARLRNLPVIKEANRAFGFFGDALRLNWADDMLEAEMRSGRTLENIIRSGDAQKIASITNNMTGWAPGKAFGSIGDLLLFAPRFLQSRLETVAKAGLGLRPGANIDQRAARRSILKMIGYGTVLTVAINEMLGEETDFEPIKKGRYNPNFMRIRYGGRDWSLFGTWDSLARALVSTASGDPMGAVRSMGSGLLQNTWDFLTNEDFMGDSVRDNPLDFAIWIAKSHSPFFLQEVPAIVGKGLEGDVLPASITLVGEVFGAKSMPLSFTDRLDILSQEMYGVKVDTLNDKQRKFLVNRLKQLEKGEEETSGMTEANRELLRNLSKDIPKHPPLVEEEAARLEAVGAQ